MKLKNRKIKLFNRTNLIIKKLKKRKLKIKIKIKIKIKAKN